MAHILSMLSGREALWQQRRDRAHARQFLRVTHNFSTVNASGTPPGSPMNIFGVNRAPGGAGEEENEFLWNCDIPGEGRGLSPGVTIFILMLRGVAAPNVSDLSSNTVTEMEA